MLNNSNHDAKGRFAIGNSANPDGRPERAFQSFKDRMVYWLETKTGDEINALVRDRKNWGKQLSIDQLVIRRIIAATKKDAATADFVAVLDRLVGRPVQPIAAEFKHTHGLAERLSAAMAIVERTSETITNDIHSETGLLPVNDTSAVE